jgi:type I restriction-modification system DNA methylase subunit
MNAQRSMGQYMTPDWAAEALVDRYFSDLGESDLVLEPSCGRGAFLRALPAHVQALGVEIDPNLAAGSPCVPPGVA